MVGYSEDIDTSHNKHLGDGILSTPPLMYTSLSVSFLLAQECRICLD